MDPDGNRLQNSCSPRHWGHSTMHRVPPVSGTTTTTVYGSHIYPYTYTQSHKYPYVVSVVYGPLSKCKLKNPKYFKALRIVKYPGSLVGQRFWKKIVSKVLEVYFG